MRVDPFVRVSILGESANADLVLPSDQSAADLMPQIVAVLQATPGPQGAYTLVTALGEHLNPRIPLGDLGIVDGSILRLVLVKDAPPVPVVSDLVDAAAEHHIAGTWNVETRGWVFSAVSAIALAASLVLLLLHRGAAGYEIAVSSLGIVVLSLGFRVLQRRDLAWCLAVTGMALSVWSGVQLVVAGIPVLAVLFSWLALQLLVLAGHTRQWLTYGSALLILLLGTGLYWGLTTVVMQPARVGAVASVVLLFLLGLAPRLALSLAGVLKADDAVGRGKSLALAEVVHRLDQAYRVLSVSVAVASLLWAVGMTLMVPGLTDNGWQLSIWGVLVVAWTLRGRHFPRVGERVAVYGSALGVVGIMAWLQLKVPLSIAALAALAGVTAAILFVQPSRAAAAQLRRAAFGIETILVLATVPLIVGLFELYSQLLRSFL